MRIVTRGEYENFLRNGNPEKAYLLEKSGDEIRVYSDIERGGDNENLRLENYGFSLSEYREQLSENLERAIIDVRAWENGSIEFTERQDFDPPKTDDDWIIPMFMDIQRTDVPVSYVICPEISGWETADSIPDGLVFIYLTSMENTSAEISTFSEKYYD